MRRKYFIPKLGYFYLTSDMTMTLFISTFPSEDQEEESERIRPGFNCLYIGSVNVGCSGDFDRIEFGIKRVLSCLPGGAGHLTLLQLSDIEIKLFQYISEDCILR